MITITLKDENEQELVIVALRRRISELRAAATVFSPNSALALDANKQADAIERIADHVEEG